MRSTTVMVALTVIALTAAAAGATYAWQKNSELEKTKRELAGAVTGLEKAKADALSAKEAANALRKEMADQKAAVDQLRSEMAAASSFLEAEKAVGARLRQELSMANEKLALLTNRRPGRDAQSIQGLSPILPMTIQSAPMRVIAIPAPAPQSRGVAQPAPAPSGGYGPVK